MEFAKGNRLEPLRARRFQNWQLAKICCETGKLRKRQEEEEEERREKGEEEETGQGLVAVFGSRREEKAFSETDLGVRKRQQR